MIIDHSALEKGEGKNNSKSMDGRIHSISLDVHTCLEKALII